MFCSSRPTNYKWTHTRWDPQFSFSSRSLSGHKTIFWPAVIRYDPALINSRIVYQTRATIIWFGADNSSSAFEVFMSKCGIRMASRGRLILTNEKKCVIRRHWLTGAFYAQVVGSSSCQGEIIWNMIVGLCSIEAVQLSTKSLLNTVGSL